MMNISEYLANGNRPLKIEFGTFIKRFSDWIVIDQDPRSDLSLNLMKPLPFPSNCVDEIYTSHLLEHFPYPQMIGFLSECLRILNPSGKFSSAVPDMAIYINGYLHPEGFNMPDLYDPAFHYFSPIDYLNYMAYLDGHHNFMFDKNNLPKIIESVGFKNVDIREFQEGLDMPERKHNSIYVKGEKE